MKASPFAGKAASPRCSSMCPNASRPITQRCLTFQCRSNMVSSAHPGIGARPSSKRSTRGMSSRSLRPFSCTALGRRSIDREGVKRLSRMTDGQIQGMLSRENVVGYLRSLRQVGI